MKNLSDVVYRCTLESLKAFCSEDMKQLGSALYELADAVQAMDTYLRLDRTKRAFMRDLGPEEMQKYVYDEQRAWRATWTEE